MYTTNPLPCTLAHACRLSPHEAKGPPRHEATGIVNKRRSDPPTSPRSPLHSPTSKRPPFRAVGGSWRAKASNQLPLPAGTVGPSVPGHGRATAAAGPGRRFLRPVLLHGGRRLLPRNRGRRARTGGPALLPCTQPRRRGRRGFRKREARRRWQGGERASIVPAFPFSGFSPLQLHLPVPNTSVCVRACGVLSSSVASAGSGGCAAPRALPAGVQRRCAAAPSPPQPAYPGTYYARCSGGVKSCVFSWLICSASPSNCNNFWCVLAGFQVFHAQQPKQGGAGVGPQPPAPRPKVRARRGQATDPHSIAERVTKRSLQLKIE